MKRWHKKLINKLPDDMILDVFNKVSINNSKLYLYLKSDPFPFVSVGLILAKLEFISLPYMDVYSICVGDVEGMSVGYAFDVYGRIIKSSLNYLISTSHEFSRLQSNSLNTDAFDMHYRLDSLLLYAYTGAGSLVTTPLSESLKECFDIK